MIPFFFFSVQNRKSTMSACCLRRRCIVRVSSPRDGVMLPSRVVGDATPGGMPVVNIITAGAQPPWEGTAMLPELHTWRVRDIACGGLVTRPQEAFDQARHDGAGLLCDKRRRHW